MPHRPRALMICPAVPDRTGNGLAMRLGTFLQGLAGIAEVDLIVPAVAGSLSGPPVLPRSLGVMINAFPIHQALDTRFSLLQRLKDPDRRIEAFRQYGRPSFSACLTADLLAYLAKLGQQRRYDLVHVGRVYMAEAGLAAATANTRLSLDLDEDDYVSLSSIADLFPADDPARVRAWNKLDAEAMDRMVAQLAPRYHRRWVSSAADIATLRERHPSLDFELVPNAVALPDEVPRRRDGRTLMFVGTFGYPPNVTGLLWFCREVWPLLRARAKVPLELLVVGAGAPPRVKRLHAPRGIRRLLGADTGIRVLGAVKDLASVYARAAVSIAPVRGGRGTRLKLLEAAAFGVPIVATSDAARGLPTEPPWAWIGDSPQAFAQACLEALADTPETAQRVAQGRHLVAASHDRSQVATEIASRFGQMLELSGSDAVSGPTAR